MRVFMSTVLLIIVLLVFNNDVTSLLVPKGLSPNVIEELESNYYSIKSLSPKGVKLKDLVSDTDFSLISTFLDDFKGVFDNPRYQEIRSGLSLRKIYMRLEQIETEVNSISNHILDEKSLKQHYEALKSLINELEAKIDAIKADPMMFTKEKADDLYERIQVLKRKYSPVPYSLEEFYAAQEAERSKTEQVDQLDSQKRTLEAQIETVKYEKQSKDFSFEMIESKIRESKEKIEDIQNQIEGFEKPKIPINFTGLEDRNVTGTAFHYIFLVDTSRREGESQNILELVHSNIEALKVARQSGRDEFTLITFDYQVKVHAERLPIAQYSKFDLRSLPCRGSKNYFEKAFNKAGQVLRRSRNKDLIPVIPVVILYTDGMRWYWEAKPVLEEEKGPRNFFWKIWNVIWSWFQRIMMIKDWSLKPIQKSDIQAAKNVFADFSKENSDWNFIGFISGTTSHNQELLGDFARELNRYGRPLQTTVRKDYEYFNLARNTEVFPQIFNTLSVAERGPVSREYLRGAAMKRIQIDNEEMEKEFLEQDDGKIFDRNQLLKERDDLEKKLDEYLRKKDKIQSEINAFRVKIEKLQSEISSIESKIRALNAEIQLANEKSFKQEQIMKDQEKHEQIYSVIRSHLGSLEQLAKTVQARDHNILTIFEYVVAYYEDFLRSLERILRNSEDSDFDLLIAFYKDRLGLSGAGPESMEKVCQLWFGNDYDQEITRTFFMMINPSRVIDDELGTREIEQAVEDFHQAKLRRSDLHDLKEKYKEFHRNLRRRISAFKTEQRMWTMNSQRDEIKLLFSPDMKKLMEKLNERIYMMY